MAEVVWTVEAVNCLEQISAYIATDNPTAAWRVINGIMDKTEMLTRQPQIGHRYEPITDREVREILYGHYRIPYLVRSPERVEILGIFHGAMDIQQYLR